MTVLLFLGLGIVGMVVLVLYCCLRVSAQSEKKMERYIQRKNEQPTKDSTIDAAQERE